MVLTRTLYGEEAAKRPDLLPEQDKERIRTLSSAVAAVVGGVSGSRDGGGNAVDVLANAQVGGVVGRNAVENNYLSQQEIENFYSDLAQCDRDDGACRKGVVERYRLLSEQNSKAMRRACLRGGGASNTECAGHLDEARAGLRRVLFPASFSDPEHYNSAATITDNQHTSMDSHTLEDTDSATLGDIVIQGSKDQFNVKHIVTYENMADIAYLDPNRENAEIIDQYLKQNTFNYTNQRISIFRLKDLTHYFSKTTPELDWTLPNQVALNQLNATKPDGVETTLKTMLFPGEVLIDSGDKAIVNTVESIPGLYELSKRLSIPNAIKFTYRMTTDYEYNLQTQDQVFGTIETTYDLGKSRVGSFGEALKQGNLHDLREDLSDIGALVAETVVGGKGASRLGTVGKGLVRIGRAERAIVRGAEAAEGAAKASRLAEAGSAARRAEQLAQGAKRALGTDTGRAVRQLTETPASREAAQQAARRTEMTELADRASSGSKAARQAADTAAQSGKAAPASGQTAQQAPLTVTQQAAKSTESLGDRVQNKYQEFYDQGYENAMRDVRDGLLPNDNRIIGRETDAYARNELRQWLKEEGIPEGPNEIVRVNRRLYDPSGSGQYRIPDVHIPGENLILDGSLGFKTNRSPQIRDFHEFGNGANTTIIVPSGLGGRGSYSIIPRR